MAEIALGEEEVLILDRIEIEEKLVAYAVALDQRNWEALNEIFIEEAKAVYGSKEIGLEIECNSREEIIEMCKNSLNGCGPTQHLFGNFRIQVSQDIAESKCSAQVGHVGKAPNQKETYEMWGEYQDKWEKINDSWRIVERRLIVLNEFGDRDKVLSP